SRSGTAGRKSTGRRPRTGSSRASLLSGLGLRQDRPADQLSQEGDPARDWVRSQDDRDGATAHAIIAELRPGPPVRATTTFSPIGSRGRDDPPVKGGHATIGTGSNDCGYRASDNLLGRLWSGGRLSRPHGREGSISVRTVVCRE